MSAITLYVHLVPQTTSLIEETIKLTMPESSLVNDLRLRILEHLQKSNVSPIMLIKIGRQ